MMMHNVLRRLTSTAVVLLAALVLAATGCSDDDGGNDTCRANLLPGDLVITEIMPNPNGADDGKEWFEIYNATTAAIDLTGVTLVFSRADGTNRHTHEIESGSIAAGEYMVFGGVLDVAKPAHVDYGYGGDLGSLTNTGGRLAIECNTTTVDEVVYLEGQDGVALAFDGRQVPDAVANDTLTAWCDATNEYETDSFGTPGAANNNCGTGPTDTCLDGGTERDVVPPVAGDVVITEFMANPDAVNDSDGEWFEVYFASNADLNGLQLGTAAGEVDFTVSDTNCISVTAGSYVLFALDGDNAVNGGLPAVDVVFSGFSLTNSGGSLFVSYDGTTLDQISYTSSWVAAGAAAALDPSKLNATDNDDGANWCDATATYGSGDLGTPGAANPSCGIVPPDTCVDPDNSTSRDIVPCTLGNVVITEFMANPSQVNDAEGEWFEVLFTSDCDLNGLVLGDSSATTTTIESADCLEVTNGDYVVFAVNTTAAQNGGLPAGAIEFGFGLSNNGDSIRVEYGGTTLDEITFTSSDNGVATSLAATALSNTQNDDEGNWCPAVASYGDGDLGTPGLANPNCN